ncbi:Helix-turn-helix [Ligilactobacillus sp. WC1T17]|uniref:Helix-turn-helix n=1 Tax=Ligilactobacillus ruminis TaxID=1623 RepID=A0ABY1ABD4_9LACO|nr:Helix-turn-helix [Ligilactobacillus ruminis]
MDNSQLDLGAKIRQYRQQAGLTQEELAEQSSLSVNYISKIERSKKTNVSIEKLSNICQTLNISLAEMFNSQDNISSKQLTPNAFKLVEYLKNHYKNRDLDAICGQVLNLLKTLN